MDVALLVDQMATELEPTPAARAPQPPILTPGEQ
jgi:hypothetical protein